MNKFYIYLILICTINIYGNDTISAVALEKIKVHKTATNSSEVLTTIAISDTVSVLYSYNGWSNVICHNKTNGYVNDEYLQKITNVKTIKLFILDKLLNNYFLIALLLCSALCYGLLNLLKNKYIHLNILGNHLIILKSFLIGFIFTTIGSIYYFYDLFSFIKIFVIGIILIILYYRISSIIKIEKQITSDKLFANNNSKENLNNITRKILIEQIANEKHKLSNIESSLDNVRKKTEEVKSEQFSIIERKLIDIYGNENINDLLNYEKPFVGLHRVFLKHFIGKPEKINESSDANNKWETYFYDKLSNRGNDGTFRLKINIQNDLVTSFQIK